MDANSNQLPVFFSTPSFSEDHFSVRRFCSRGEAISSHYHIWIEAITSAIVDLPELVGKNGHLQWGNNWRHGIIASVHDRGKQRDGYCYIIELVSPFHPLFINQHSRIFVNKKLSEILTVIFNDLTFTIKNDILVPYFVQHKELDYNFFTRILKNYHWSWVYQHNANQSKIVIIDNLTNIVNDSIFIESLTHRPIVTKQDLYNTVLVLETDNILLKAGDLVKFDHQEYRILRISHRKNYRKRYIANVKLISPVIGYYARNPYAIIKHRTPYLTATVESEGGNYPYLYQDGRYFSRLYFDQSDILPTQASQPQYLVAPHDGMHFPIMAGTQVAVSHIDGNVSSPILVGVMSDNVPVTSANNSQHIYRTTAGNQLLIDDKAEQTQIQFNSPLQKNIFLLDATKENVRTVLQSQEKMICVEAGEDNQTRCQDSHVQQSKNHRITVKNDQTITAQNIEIQSGKNIGLSAKNNINLQSHSLQMLSQKQVSINTKNGLILNSGNGNVILKTTTNNFLLHGQKKIVLQASDTVNVLSGSTGISMNGNQLVFTGEQLKVNAQSISCPQPTLTPANATAGSMEDSVEIAPINFSSISFQPVPIIKLKNKTDDEEFKLFVATVYGEAANSSEAAWKAIASVIVNRVHHYRYQNGKSPKSIKEVIQETGFDAYSQQNAPYVSAINYMHAHPGWVENPSHMANPPNLYSLRQAIGEIYISKVGTINACYYFSPRTQDWLHQHKPDTYHRSADDVRKYYISQGYHKVGVPGLKPNDDFEFYGN